MRKSFVFLGSFMLILMPVLVSATNHSFGVVDTYLGAVSVFINNTLIPILIAVAFLVFIWGAVQYLIIADDTGEGREKGKKLMLWGIIGFVLIVSIWGIVLLLSGGLNLEDANLLNVPGTPIR